MEYSSQKQAAPEASPPTDWLSRMLRRDSSRKKKLAA
jgi:hypothetical protein